MPRPPRIHFPGALFHTMAHGNAGQKIFLDKADYQAFVKILSDLKIQKPFLLYAYCLMPNHLHLLMELDRFPLSILMQSLLTRYSKHFNIRHKRSGHLFQGRYKAILCQKDAYLQELVRYIHLNPVRAKLVEDAADWQWSGHSDYLDQMEASLVDTGFPLSLFHRHLPSSQQLYARFVQEGVGLGHTQDYYPPQVLPCLGEEAFISGYRELVNKRVHGESAEGHPVSLEYLATQYKNSIPLEVLVSGSQARRITSARKDFILRALKDGHKPSLIAAFLRCSPSAVSKVVKSTL